MTQSAQEIIDAFTKTGSARPELLKNKEALVAVTQEAIILSNASKTTLQPAIEALTMVMNQYNVPATEARRIINALGAGSKEGAGEIPYLTTAFEKAGTVAADAGISIETLVATIETLAPRITQPEIAGRSLKGVLIDLQQGADDTNPSVVGLSTALENLGKKNLSITDLTGKFGKENITTAAILIKNVEELKRYEKAVTGTNVAVEQAIINTDNNNARLAQAKNRINIISIELGEKLAPSMTQVTGWTGKALKIFSALIDILVKYGPTIVTTTAAIVAYTVATKLSAMWTERNNASSLISVAIQRAQALAYNAQFAALSLYNAAAALLSGNLRVAAIQFRAFSAAMYANPIGIIVGLLVAAGTALYFYSTRMTQAQIIQKTLNDVNLDARKNIVEEKIRLQTLFDIARDENRSRAERIDAIRELNALSPQYLGYLTLESVGSDKAAQSVKAYTDSLLEKAKVTAAQQKLAEIEKQRLDELSSGEDRKVTFWQHVQVGFMAGNNPEVQQRMLEEKASENATKSNEAYLASVKAVRDVINKGDGGGAGDQTSLNRNKGEVQAAQDLIKVKEKELEAAKLMPGTTLAEIAARNRAVAAIQGEINKLQELGTAKSDKKTESGENTQEKTRLEALEAANSKEMAAINRRHLEGKTSEDQYNADLLKQELKFLEDKMNLYKVGSKEYEQAEAQLFEKRVSAEKTVKEMLLKAEKGLAEAKIASLQEGIDRQKAIEELRWQEELAGLKKQLLEKKELSKDELALNDTVRKTIEERTAAHNKTMTDLNTAALLQQQMDRALIDQAHARSDEQRWAAETELAHAQYAQEVADAKGNAALIAQAERKLSDRIIQVKTDEMNRRQQIGDAVFGAANNLFGSLSDLFGKETALGKAMFLAQQAAAIGQIIFNTAIANAKAVAASPLTFGQPWVTINTVTAGLSIASVLAQTISNMSGKKSKDKGMAEGGFTGVGGKYEEAGVVHKGEYVIPREGVNNRSLIPLIGIIEQARRNRRLEGLELNPLMRFTPHGGDRGFSEGGFTSQPPAVTVSAVQQSPAENGLLLDAINRLNTNLEKGITARATINKYGHNGLDEALAEITRFKTITK